jgi:hypothetical protein
MRRTTRIGVVVVLVLGVVGRLEAASLKVSPARFIVHNVEPGRLYDIYKETGVRLTVYNDSDVSRTWNLSTHRPSERGRWETGYGEIPDATWCWFEMNEITVEPNSKAYANLYMKVPDEVQYYNQHWVVTLNVGGKPGRGLALAVDVRVQIETKSKVGMTTKPYGLLGLEPSMVRFDNVVPGTSRTAQVMLYNNDNTSHTYAISSLFEKDDTRFNSYLTRFYSVIPDATWIGRSQDTITIKAGERAVLNLELKIPADRAYFDNKWEEILLIEPDQGRAGFVRVQVETKKKDNAE